jgi:hypothetical protein
MRYVFGFILFVVALGVVGCGDKCSRPLSDYCSGAECPTFEETVGRGVSHVRGDCSRHRVAPGHHRSLR